MIEAFVEQLAAESYFEETGKSFWEDLSPTEQRKEIENYIEDRKWTT